MPSDIFNTDIIANNISKLKDYPIVLAWYWAEFREPYSWLSRFFSKKGQKVLESRLTLKEIIQFSWDILLKKLKNTH